MIGSGGQEQMIADQLAHQVFYNGRFLLDFDHEIWRPFDQNRTIGFGNCSVVWWLISKKDLFFSEILESLVTSQHHDVSKVQTRLATSSMEGVVKPQILGRTLCSWLCLVEVDAAVSQLILSVLAFNEISPRSGHCSQTKSVTCANIQCRQVQISTVSRGGHTFTPAQEDINCIMKTLELDEDVSSVVSSGGQKVFMKKRKGAGRSYGRWASVKIYCEERGRATITPSRSRIWTAEEWHL